MKISKVVFFLIGCVCTVVLAVTLRLPTWATFVVGLCCGVLFQALHDVLFGD